MEKRDELWPRGPCFYYDTALFPPGTDSFCLAYFARPSRGDTVCDLGSGIGLLGTLLLARQESLFIENVELSAPAAALARKTFAENGWADRAAFREGDLRDVSVLPKAGSVDYVISNPPYFPAGSGDLLGAQFAAADELGIRMYASRGSMDLSKKDGGLPPDSVVQTVDEILRDSVHAIEAYHDASYGAMHRVALAPCSPFSVSADLLRESAKLARQYGVRLHTHLCETKDEENFMLAREGVRPLAYMERLGWIGNDVWFAHGIHFNDEELRLLAQTGTGVAHCPISNMKLASGVARIPEMLELGVPVGLAVDGSASNDGSSLLEELRAAFLLHRLTSSRRAPTGYDVLKMATRGSARLLGRDDIGQLAEGKCADLFMIDARRLELVGCGCGVGDLLGTVGVRGPVDYTIVHGRVTVEDGRLTTVDEEQLAREAEAKCRAYLAM